MMSISKFSGLRFDAGSMRLARTRSVMVFVKAAKMAFAARPRFPAGRMKGKKGKARPHTIPLSSIAMGVLDRQLRATGGVGPVFPGRATGSSLSRNTFFRAGAATAGSPHGWRSVFSDACGEELKIQPHLVEFALAHTFGDVEGAYRRETAIEARRPVMEAYARWRLGVDANVVTLPSREAA